MVTNNKMPSSGYRLYCINDDVWHILFNGKAFSGHRDQMINFMINELGFEVKEINFAIKAMNEGMYNGAEFGLFKSFMWPFDIEEDIHGKNYRIAN